MRQLLNLLLLFLLLGSVACKKTEGLHMGEPSQGEAHIVDGIYMGSIAYQGVVYWSQIAFENNTYQEYASGGVMSQKFPTCLTKGKYTFRGGAIRLSGVVDNSAAAPCIPELEFTGDFHYYTSPDSISFWRYAGNDKVEYRLKKMIIN